MPLIGTDYNENKYCQIVLNNANSSSFVFKNNKKIFSREVDTFYLSTEKGEIGLFPHVKQIIFENNNELKKQSWEICSESAKGLKKATFLIIND
uniref:Uncharacterized protein n=1 Tax=Meloidogyne enterolobii TaxID=390850 RepID=A0A6V7VPD0_MELEN|nr:unnamed protein product [Meloidogyne enterolobii]